MLDGTYFLKPGLHSHNAARTFRRGKPQSSRRLSKIRVLLFALGVSCLGYYSYTLADQQIYQVYENWAFDQQIGGRRGVTFGDYLRERTPFAFLAGTKVEAPAMQAPPDAAPALREGSLIGRVAIDRLNLSAVVLQGVDEKTLSQAVGHVPSTALPGQPGNFAIAAHRDTLFRALKDIEKGDLVTFQTKTGLFRYQVVATRIVKPTDVSVLRPDGGGLIPDISRSSPNRLLTMITCYPFYYVGSAPNRFIVEAELIGSSLVKGLAGS